MPTHTMSKDADPFTINLFKVLKHSLRQFLRDVAVHLIALRPRRLSSVNVEACAAAKVIGVVFAFNLEATYRRLR